MSLPLENVFAALADRTRLRLLNLVAAGEVCVCFLVDVLDEPQPKISRHLAYLREAGLVEARRDGKWIHYRAAKLLKPEAKIIDTVMSAIADDAQMRRDRAALLEACCAAKLPESLRNAPRPSMARR